MIDTDQCGILRAAEFRQRSKRRIPVFFAERSAVEIIDNVQCVVVQPCWPSPAQWRYYISRKTILISNDRMTTIRAMNLNALDLNLIRVFDALLKERNVTRAGQRIGLSQPAVSSALGRLRAVLDDPLFLRHGGQMEPTAKALEIGTHVQSAIATLEQGLGSRLPFDPSAMNRKFRMLGADFFSVLFMPAFSARLAKLAPGVELGFLDNARGDALQLLQSGFADLTFEEQGYAPVGFSSQLLFHSVFAVALRKGHPALDGVSLTPGDMIPRAIFDALNFAVYSQDGGESGCVLDRADARGQDLRISLTLPHFHAVAIAAHTGDVAALIPCQFAEAVAQRLGLIVFRLPVDLGIQKIGMHWHPRLDTQAEHAWLRAQIADLIGEMGLDASCEPYR